MATSSKKIIIADRDAPIYYHSQKQSALAIDEVLSGGA
jgi:hypothetical protein